MRGLDEHLENQANSSSNFKAGNDKPRKPGTKIKKAYYSKKEKIAMKMKGIKK